MATVNLTVKHRPVRIGFVVRAGEAIDLERVSSFCALLWGGMYNPVIPVASADDAAADLLVQAFQVDVLFNTAVNDATTGFIERYPALRHPHIYTRDLMHRDWKSKKDIVAYLDVLNAIDKYWEQDFKHAAEGIDSSCRLVTWDDADSLGPMFRIGFGAYDPDLPLLHNFEQAFVNGLRAKKVAIAPDAAVPADLARKTTPMRLTAADLSGSRGSFRTWAGGLYFGDASDLADLTTFWNIRAGGAAIEFVCLKAIERLTPFARAHLDALDALPQRHPNIEDHIAVFFRKDQEAVLAAVKELPVKKRLLLCQARGGAGDVSIAAPAAFHFDWGFGLGLVDRDDGAYAITLSLPEKRFLHPARRLTRREQQIAVSINAHGEFGHAGFTLQPPFRPDLNEFYGRQIQLSPWSVRSEPEGISVFTNLDDKTVHLRPIKHAAVVEALFEKAGLGIEPSQGGRLADRLLDALGGYESTRVFKIRGVRNLIQGHVSQDAVGRGDATGTIWNGGQFKEHEKLYIESRDTAALTADAVFDYLLKNNFYRAGLEFKCDSCGLTSWLSLRQVDDHWICEYCGRSNMTSLHVRNRGDWRFRKSGLLAKDNNQEGAIPVLLTLLALGRVVDGERLLRLTSVNVTKGIPTCEIDFVALHHRGEEISCGIGEAKAAGGFIDANDIANLKCAGDALRKAGIAPYLILSKAADTLRPEELALFKATRAEGYEVILLTNQELEPYHPYGDGPRDNKLPEPYASSFADMAVNTAARYFGET
jgi:hypothetical protein